MRAQFCGPSFRLVFVAASAIGLISADRMMSAASKTPAFYLITVNNIQGFLKRFIEHLSKQLILVYGARYWKKTKFSYFQYGILKNKNSQEKSDGVDSCPDTGNLRTRALKN